MASEKQSLFINLQKTNHEDDLCTNHEDDLYYLSAVVKTDVKMDLTK